MQLDDLEQVMKIENENFSRPWTETGFFTFLIRQDTLFLIAAEGEEILGYCGVVMVQDEGDITNVSVKKDRQNHGTGKLLVQELIRITNEMGVSRLFLEVRESNERAIHVYEKAGFVKNGLRKNYYENPVEHARYNGSSLMIDCGEGTQVAVKSKGWSFKPIDVICFTHYHADHISGLPGMLLTMGNAERTEPLTLIGPKGLERVVNALRTIAPELPFPIICKEIQGQEEKFSVRGYEITAFRVNHNVTCYGYTVEIRRGGKFSVEQAKANEIPLKYWNPLQKGESIEAGGKVYTPDMVLGPARKGLKVTYCTDSRPTVSMEEHAKESDLLICEGMYGEPEKDAKAREYKHMTMKEAAKLAKKAQVKEMWLTHFSPSLVHPEEYMDGVREIFPNSYVGKDGKSVDLLFEEEENE